MGPRFAGSPASPSPVPRLVLFDIDGTLIRTNRAGMLAFDRVFATVFQRPRGADHLQFAGRTDTSIVADFFAHHAIEPDAGNFQTFFDTYVFWLEHILHESNGVVLPGVLRLINDLRQMPDPPAIGLLTGNIRLGAEIKLRHYDLWKHFEMGAFGDDHADRNQLAVIARERGQHLIGDKLTHRDIVVVGDTPHDIRCARAIDAPCLAVATGASSRDELATHKPEWLVNELSEIAATDLRK